MKNIKRLFFTILIAFLAITSLNKVYSLSTNIDTIVTDEGLKVAEKKIEPSKYNPGSILDQDDDEIEFGNKIIGYFQAIGSIVSVLALVFIGIKYMLGSVDQKAEYKNTMIYYIIGAILVFAISNISKILYDIAKEF